MCGGRNGAWVWESRGSQVPRSVLGGGVVNSQKDEGHQEEAAFDANKKLLREQVT